MPLCDLERRCCSFFALFPRFRCFSLTLCMGCKDLPRTWEREALREIPSNTDLQCSKSHDDTHVLWSIQTSEHTGLFHPWLCLSFIIPSTWNTLPLLVHLDYCCAPSTLSGFSQTWGIKSSQYSIYSGNSDNITNCWVLHICLCSF